MTWTEDHGPDELYNKFVVYRASNGEKISGGDEFVFVLRPESDKLAWIALFSYAVMVRDRSPNLADQITEKLVEIRKDNE